MKESVVTTLIEASQGCFRTMPSRTPVEFSGRSAETAGLLLLVGYSDHLSPGVQLVPNNLCRCYRLPSDHSRNFGRIVVFSWGGSKWPLGFNTLKVELARVPPSVVKASLASQVGAAFVSSSQPLRAEGTAIWLVQHVLDAGAMWIDLSPEGCAELQGTGERPDVCDVLRVALRAVFQVQVPRDSSQRGAPYRGAGPHPRLRARGIGRGLPCRSTGTGAEHGWLVVGFDGAPAEQGVHPSVDCAVDWPTRGRPAAG